jgi:UDP-glucuronate 4-epimerase
LRVVHLAAQAGVRHSLVDPDTYVDSNIVGFSNLLEGCRRVECQHLLYASSSSVYGGNTCMPFRTSDNVDHPLNHYGATKKANELSAARHSLARSRRRHRADPGGGNRAGRLPACAPLFALPVTGLRFFTIYGPWGRRDMAMWLFAAAIRDGKPIRLFNRGRMRRDFTYVDDVTEAVVRLLDCPPTPNPVWSSEAPDPASSSAPWRVYNIGNSQPVAVLDIVSLLEKEMGKSVRRELLPMQPGDVPETYADCADLERAIGFRPRTPIGEGVRQFVEWFREFHNLRDSSASVARST